MDDSDFQRVAFLFFGLPFLVLGLAMAIERKLMLRGSVTALRFGIPIGGWTEDVGIEIPASVAPSRFPTVDELAPGKAYETDVKVRAHWVNDGLIAFWDERSRGGVNTSGLIVTALLAIDRSAGAKGTVLHVQRHLRIIPLLTIVAAAVAFGTVIPMLFGPDHAPWDFVVGIVAMFGIVTALNAVLAARKLRVIYDEISAELMHRAKTGTPTLGAADLAELEAARPSIGDLFG